MPTGETSFTKQKLLHLSVQGGVEITKSVHIDSERFVDYLAAFCLQQNSIASK